MLPATRKNAGKTLRTSKSRSLMRGVAVAFFLAAAPAVLPAQGVEAQVTGSVAPYPERLQQARKHLDAAIALKDDPNPAVRALMVTNIGRHGMEFGELSETAFSALSTFLNDPDMKVAAQAAEQVGTLGEKYPVLSMKALAVMLQVEDLKNDRNHAQSMNIVRAATTIGEKSEPLARVALDLLSRAEADPQAEPFDLKNRVLEGAARGIGALGAKYPALENMALMKLEYYAKTARDTDMGRGVIDGANDIGSSTKNRKTLAEALKIISVYRSHPNIGLRWHADEYIGHLRQRRMGAEKHPQP